MFPSDVPDHISLWSLILPIRKYNNQYVNVRPTRILPGTVSPLSQCERSPKDLDWVIIRENSEGEYAGQGGTTHENSPHTIATVRRCRQYPREAELISTSGTCHLHPGRYRAYHALCVRHSKTETKEEIDNGHQEQRPETRHGPLGQSFPRSREGISRR